VALGGRNGAGQGAPQHAVLGDHVLVDCFQEVKATPPIAYVVNILLINHGHATWLPWLDATAEEVTAFP